MRLEAFHPSTLLRVRWHVPASEERPVGPLPYRCRDGRLIYPLAGHGWYWKEELRMAMDGYGADNFEILEAWEFVPGCAHEPFAWVVQLYAERLRLGKDGAGLVLKFALNALYGKLAQAAGGGGRFTEWVWAGMITARTRAQLMDLALLAGRHAVMLATDGSYVDSVPPSFDRVTTFAEHAPLGAWQYDAARSVFRGALLIQSGLWVDGQRLRHADNQNRPDENEKAGGRTRGIGHRALTATNGYARLYAAWERDGLGARVAIDAGSTAPGHSVPRVFVGIRSGLHDGRPEEIGTWRPVNKTVCFAPEPKRVRTKPHRGETFVRTVPAMNDDRMAGMGVNAMLELSAPYRRLARKDAIKDLYYEQPEPVDGLAALGDEW